MKRLRVAAASLAVAAFGISSAVPSQSWYRVFNQTLQDQAVAVARDSVGSVYVLGRRQTAATNVDWVLLRYSSIGTLLWTRFLDGPAHGSDYPLTMTVDRFNNVWVAGSEKYLTGDRPLVLKFSPAGVQLRKAWMNKSAAGYDAFHSVTSDTLGNVVLTGTMNRPGTGRDFVTLKLSQTGIVWWRYWTTTGNMANEAKKVLTDNAGNVFVMGTSMNANQNRDVMLVKYSPTGALLWVRSHAGPATDDDLAAGILDGGGNPVLAVRESKGTYSTCSIHRRLGTSGALASAVFRYPLNTSWHMVPHGLARDTAGGIYLATTHYWRAGELTYSRVVLARFNLSCVRQWERYISFGGSHTLAGNVLIGPTNSAVVFVTVASKTTPASEMRALRYTNAGGFMYNYRFGRPLPAVDACVDVAQAGTSAYVAGTGRANSATSDHDITLYRLINL